MLLLFLFFFDEFQNAFEGGKSSFSTKSFAVHAIGKGLL
jgi:hypothetical protein